MESTDRKREGDLAKPLWVIAIALWVIALAGMIGAVKVYQAQMGLQEEIEKIRRWPRL